MKRSIPQLVSLVTVFIGVLLFAITLYSIDLRGTFTSVRRLGLAFPIVMLPSICWHLLRTWGWSVAFPDDARPPFSRLFRVRLAADAISFFTVRGIAGEPLKVLLLYDRTSPRITTAAVALERLAFAVIGIVVAGLVSSVAVSRIEMSVAWNAIFTLLAVSAVLLLLMLALLARRRTGDYLGRFVMAIQRITGREMGASAIVRFILDVEDVMLELIRGSRRRLLILTGLPVLCYLVMTLEVWLVFWAIGQQVGVTEALAVETFARLASVASAAIPANIGALEASNAGVATALGLTGGGALALARRIRSLIFAALGLALYPRLSSAQPPRRQLPAASP